MISSKSPESKASFISFSSSLDPVESLTILRWGAEFLQNSYDLKSETAKQQQQLSSKKTDQEKNAYEK